jgi:predicted transcriptional regulator
MNDKQDKDETCLELTVDIVAAYVSNNPIPANELPSLIASVNASISGLLHKPAVEETPLVPAVNPRRSVHDDHIVCLEDGKKFKSLKRHIATHHGLSSDEYRAKWGLPADYPMVAPGYSAARSALAKTMGLGRKPKAQPEPVVRRNEAGSPRSLEG